MFFFTVCHGLFRVSGSLGCFVCVCVCVCFIVHLFVFSWGGGGGGGVESSGLLLLGLSRPPYPFFFVFLFGLGSLVIRIRPLTWDVRPSTSLNRHYHRGYYNPY